MNTNRKSRHRTRDSRTGSDEVGWMNCQTGREEFSDWRIDLTFVSQWECNLFLCELLLTQISVCELNASLGGAVRNVSLWPALTGTQRSLLKYSTQRETPRVIIRRSSIRQACFLESVCFFCSQLKEHSCHQMEVNFYQQNKLYH